MLTAEQINDITFYCYTRGVDYYDVQLELVDHLADMIEALQQEQPGLAFKDAVEIAGKQFSKAEFKKIVKSKKKQLRKRVSRLIEKEFLDFFTVPKIVLTATLLLGAWILPSVMAESKIMGIGFVELMLVPYFYYSWVYRKELKLIAEDRKSNLLCLKVRSNYEKMAILTAISLNLFFNVFKNLFDIHFNVKNHLYIVAIILMLGVMLEILFIAIIFVRVAFNEKMKSQYPNAFA
jgi:hypothetical protein